MKADAGFSLLETLVAVTLLGVGVGALAQLSVIAADAGRRARGITTASVLAQQKMEQLRALAWWFDRAGQRVTDDASDTSIAPESPTGGRGLSLSPAASLTTNIPGYYDYVDASGRLLGDGGGGTVPTDARYIRRWAIAPVFGDPDDTIAIQVLVAPTGARRAGEAARLIMVRTRWSG